jgi:uncharacterized membrane protein required for colicin V production
MATEFIIFLVSLIPILAGAYLGWRLGAFAVIQYAAGIALATLFAERLWPETAQRLTSIIPASPGLITSAVFIILFAVGALLACLAVNIRKRNQKDTESNVIDSILGLAMGLGSGVLVAGIALTLVGLLWTTVASRPYEANRLPLRIDHAPGAFLHAVQKPFGVRTPIAEWDPQVGTVSWK